MSIKQELEELRQRALTELKAIKDKSGLAELEIKYLGRKGEIARAFKNLKAVVAEEKPVLGELANQVKAEIEQAFIKAKSSILSSDQTRAVDLTIPGLKPLVGHMHPVLQVQRDLENLFRSMGFLVLDGPELESEYYNFEALNNKTTQRIPDARPFASAPKYQNQTPPNRFSRQIRRFYPAVLLAIC